MQLYNTMTNRKEEFVPVHEGKVGMYVCGPTVYNYIHIGNARPMVVFDTVRRYFEYKGYDVNYVSNFTDVDDKIIKRANEEGVSSQEISERYIEECKKDMQGLNVKEATHHPKATEEIDGMINMVQTLIDKGYAYEKDGTVYFRTRHFKDYGHLSNKNLDDMQAGIRIAVRFDAKGHRTILQQDGGVPGANLEFSQRYLAGADVQGEYAIRSHYLTASYSSMCVTPKGVCDRSLR